MSTAIIKEKKADEIKKSLVLKLPSSTILLITRKKMKNLKNKKDLIICSLNKILTSKLGRFLYSVIKIMYKKNEYIKY
tara:strand:- start:328 stop:561 length:234 start_codon:yes stop_codon:yes gene_type:complete